jgi:hypothetical protein
MISSNRTSIKRTRCDLYLSLCFSHSLKRQGGIRLSVAGGEGLCIYRRGWKAGSLLKREEDPVKRGEEASVG